MGQLTKKTAQAPCFTVITSIHIPCPPPSKSQSTKAPADKEPPPPYTKPPTLRKTFYIHSQAKQQSHGLHVRNLASQIDADRWRARDATHRSTLLGGKGVSLDHVTALDGTGRYHGRG
ncbi:hypothetical protein FDECE_16108 [Fusarium decemcellulare]|nr:hypothetical protein FDECE_16108 [Fusarium decemcellulare]